MDSQTLPRLPFLCRLRSLRRSVSVASAVPHSRSARESTISGLRPWVPRTALFCALITWSVLAQEKPSGPTESPRGLAGLDLTALMNIEVTSVSGRPERRSDAAGSIFGITGDEIRPSGATSLPEALRLAPALDVVQVSASGYTISARGFLNSGANKLLVLIDGRTVYTPLFSGVFWDAQDVLIEDIDRIEVISGPGGTLWGVNAVNGVINVITRSAKTTQGGLVSAGGGNRETMATLRHGGEAGSGGNYRVYGKYFDRGHTETANGTVKHDAWHRSTAGFRADWGRAADPFTGVGPASKSPPSQTAPRTIAIFRVDLFTRSDPHPPN